MAARLQSTLWVRNSPVTHWFINKCEKNTHYANYFQNAPNSWWLTRVCPLCENHKSQTDEAFCGLAFMWSGFLCQEVPILRYSLCRILSLSLRRHVLKLKPTHHSEAALARKYLQFLSQYVYSHPVLFQLGEKWTAVSMVRWYLAVFKLGLWEKPQCVVSITGLIVIVYLCIVTYTDGWEFTYQYMYMYDIGSMYRSRDSMMVWEPTSVRLYHLYRHADVSLYDSHCNQTLWGCTTFFPVNNRHVLTCWNYILPSFFTPTYLSC